MPYQEDGYYISKTIQGDLNAFGLLIQKHEDFAYTLAFRILKNQEDAEEATQDAFLKVYHSLASFEGNSKFTTWLYTIVYHEALGKLRKVKVNMVSQDSYENQSVISEQFLDGMEMLEVNERKEIVQKGLQYLKPNESAVLTLFYLEELSIKEIMAITSQSESQIKILLHRGRKNLCKIIEKITNKELINLL